jgi:hypothetical protein
MSKSDLNLPSTKIREYLNSSPTLNHSFSRYTSSPSPSKRSLSSLKSTPPKPKKVYLQLKSHTPNSKFSKPPPAQSRTRSVHQTPRKVELKLSNDLLEPVDSNIPINSYLRPSFKEPKETFSHSFELDTIQPLQNKQESVTLSNLGTQEIVIFINRQRFQDS